MRRAGQVARGQCTSRAAASKFGTPISLRGAGITLAFPARARGNAEGRLLANPAELTRLIGDVKSELFHYEVRATYDTPEVADSRRIVNDALKQAEQGNQWQKKQGTEDGDDSPEW